MTRAVSIIFAGMRTLAAAALALLVFVVGCAPEPAAQEPEAPESPPKVAVLRHIPFEGQPNFRDLGGYLATDGRTMKEGLIYRSGELNKLSDADVAKLEELGIRTVVDFRSELEVESRGADRLPEGVTYLPLHIDGGDLSEVLLGAIQTGDMGRVPDNVLADVNRAIISGATDQYAALFEAISDPANLPLVFHCTHGKDRAGVASAVILMALGVPAADARADYLLSNTYREEENARELGRLREMVAARQEVDPAAVDLSKLEAIFYLEPSYFDAMMLEIDERYGSLDAYLEDGLGLGSPERANLRDLLTRENG